jgi:hypothetical protein
MDGAVKIDAISVFMVRPWAGVLPQKPVGRTALRRVEESTNTLLLKT